jgi:hypothetical protein
VLLINNWDKVAQWYIFCCEICNQYVIENTILMCGNPQNLALSLHWDGFQFNEGQERGSCVVEVAVFNASTSDPSIMLLPVLFIPQMHTTSLCIVGSQLLEKKVKKFALEFLLPLMEDLERIFST